MGGTKGPVSALKGKWTLGRGGSYEVASWAGKNGEGLRAMSLAYISCFPERPHGSLPFL